MRRSCFFFFWKKKRKRKRVFLLSFSSPRERASESPSSSLPRARPTFHAFDSYKLSLSLSTRRASRHAPLREEKESDQGHHRQANACALDESSFACPFSLSIRFFFLLVHAVSSFFDHSPAHPGSEGRAHRWPRRSWSPQREGPGAGASRWRKRRRGRDGESCLTMTTTTTRMPPRRRRLLLRPLLLLAAAPALAPALASCTGRWRA